MKKRVLFWIDQSLIHFGIAKFLQENSNCEIYSIYEITEKPKIFFQTQNIVNFQKIWFLHDHLLNNKNLDKSFLEQIENKYSLNLHLIALNDRLFTKLNNFYKFSHDEILLILQNEIKLFEKILDEINPDFIIMPISHQQHNHIFYKICKARQIKILMIIPSRVGIDTQSSIKHTHRYFLSDEIDPYLPLPKNSFSNNTEKSNPKFNREYNYHFQNSKKEYFKAGLKFLSSYDDNIKTHYSYFGREKFRVIFKTLAYELKKTYREKFMNKNLQTKIPNDNSHYVYYPLHQEMERILLIGAPFFINQLQNIKHIASSLPVGYKLIVKDHTVMNVRGWRSVNEMKQIMSLPNVILLHPMADSSKIIDQSNLVISIRGSTSIEAAFRKKPSIIFDKVGMYQLSTMTLVDSINELPKVIKQSLNQKVDDDEIELYSKSVYENTFDFPFYEISAGFEQQFKIGGYYANVEINQDKMLQFFKEHNDEFTYLIQKFIEKMGL